MPYCPQCREEYVASVSRCADCGVELVAEMAATLDPRLSPLEIECPAELLDEVAEMIRRASIPVRVGSRVLEVPAGLRAPVLRVLQGALEVSETDSRVCVVARRATDELEVAAEVLEWDRRQLLEDTHRSVSALCALLRGRADRARLAARKLRLLHEADAVDLRALLLEALRSEDAAAALLLSGELRELEPADADLALRICELIPSLSVSGTSLALHVIGRHQDARVAPYMLALLEHEDAGVRSEADEVLCWISKLDMGFEADAGPARRAEVVKRWTAWVRERES